MKALVKKERRPGLWMEEIPLPESGPNDVLVRIIKTGICGTDLHIYNWDEWAARTIPLPIAIGHEWVGVVEKAGSQVQGFELGCRVSGEGHITCGSCRNCRAGKRHLCPNTIAVGVNRPGCFAEYLCFPASNLYKVPPEVPDDIAAIFDPFGNAVHAALSFDLAGEDVLITGAGPIGCMAAAVCKHAGARHVVISDIYEDRLRLASRLGATSAINVQNRSLKEALHELKIEDGFTVGLEMSGNGQALGQMLELMNHGGRVALLGIFPSAVAIDWGKVIFKGLFLKGIYGREIFETWVKMIHFLQSGLDISAVITHRLPADEFEKGFLAMKQHQAGKVVLDWTA